MRLRLSFRLSIEELMSLKPLAPLYKQGEVILSDHIVTHIKMQLGKIYVQLYLNLS